VDDRCRVSRSVALGHSGHSLDPSGLLTLTRELRPIQEMECSSGWCDCEPSGIGKPIMVASQFLLYITPSVSIFTVSPVRRTLTSRKLYKLILTKGAAIRFRRRAFGVQLRYTRQLLRLAIN
jgi:hypothetical protein